MREQGYGGEIVTTLALKASGADKLISGVQNISLVDFKEMLVQNEYSELKTYFKDKFGKDITPSEILFFNSTLLAYKAALETSTPGEIAKNIKRQQSTNLMGETMNISETNDILPEIVIKSR